MARALLRLIVGRTQDFLPWVNALVFGYIVGAATLTAPTLD
jgi:hypothetical protein